MGHHSLLCAANRRAAAASGLRFTVHGPFEDLETGSTSRRRRRAALEEHRRHIEAAAEIGATAYVVHPDFCGRPGRRQPRVLDALAHTVADLERLQHDTGVRIVVENMPGQGCSHFVGPGDLDLGALGFALDAGHAAISGTLLPFLADPSQPVTHVHLHDNRGPVDAHDPHLPLGRGAVDARAVLTRARADGATVILELASEADALESIAYLDRLGLLTPG